MGDANSNIDAVSFKPIGTRQVIVFFCVFIVVYGLLMVPWPGLRAAYAGLYSAGANCIFRLFGLGDVVRLQPFIEGEGDMKIIFYKPGQAGANGVKSPVGFVRRNSRRDGYVCTSFLAALILATPIPWKRKGSAMLWAMFLIHVFIIAKLGVWIIYGLNKELLSLLSLSPFWKGGLLLIIDMFVRNLTFGFVVGVFIWVLVTFRRQDWMRISVGGKSLCLTERRGKPRPTVA